MLSACITVCQQEDDCFREGFVLCCADEANTAQKGEEDTAPPAIELRQKHQMIVLCDRIMGVTIGKGLLGVLLQ